MDATPTNNRSALLITTVTHSQKRHGCICMWALPVPCYQRFYHLFVWNLPFYLPGLLRPARSTDFCQYSSQGRGITVPPLRHVKKHLGLCLDEKLESGHNINVKVSKANNGIGIIKRRSHFLPRQSLITL